MYSFLKNFYSINKQDLLSFRDTKKNFKLNRYNKTTKIFLVLIIILFIKKSFIFPDNGKFTQKLLETYITSLSELYELTNYILSFKKNMISSNSIKRILYSNILINHIYKGGKHLLIENLMINYSTINIKKNKPKELLTYFIIIIRNSNIIFQDYIIDWNILNKTIKGNIKDFLINTNNYDINIKNMDN